jgi:ketosteroid isomerase-like protein
MTNVEITRRSYEAFARDDMDGVVADMHPEIEWHQAQGLPHGGCYRGLEEVRRAIFAPLDEEWWDEFSADPDEFLDAGDEVMVLGRAVRPHLDVPRRQGDALPPVPRHRRLDRSPQLSGCS